MDGKHASELASERTSYQLTYARDPSPRVFQHTGISGSDIPCSYGSGIDSSGEWCQDMPLWDDDSVDWTLEFLKCAINEATHEVLEWFQVDEVRVLDPHVVVKGETTFDARQDVIDLANEFAERLYALR